MLTKTSNDQTILTDSSYNFSKKLVQLWLPALGTLYFGLASIWNLPAPDKVTGTILCLTTFLGVVLNVSHARYEASGAGFDGTVHVTETESGRTRATLELDGDPEEILANSSTLKFKVDTPPPPEIMTLEQVDEPAPVAKPAKKATKKRR